MAIAGNQQNAGQPSTEELIQQLQKGEGWGGLDLDGSDVDERNKEQLQKQFDERLEFARKYAKVLDASEGTITNDVLQDLVNRTICQPTWNPNENNADKMGYYREGQNRIVRFILEQIAIARSGKIQGMTREEYVNAYG